MLALKLAIRNLIGGKLRTWLNVFVLSLAFILLVFMNGLIEGWNRQSSNDLIQWAYGSGQYWAKGYDKLDPLSINDAHQEISAKGNQLISDSLLTPLLIREATAYPNGRMKSVLLYGIDPDQTLLLVPSASLKNQPQGIILGSKMAQDIGIKEGEEMLIRWRDAQGTFDALSFKVLKIFYTDASETDKGLLYIDINTLRSLTQMDNQATILTGKIGQKIPNLPEWEFKSQDWLLSDLKAIIETKKVSSSVMGLLLLLIGLLAIFDAQVLAVFRRQKEIGTYVALGMTPSKVKWIFTLEGTLNSIFAAVLGTALGLPLFIYLAKNGIDYSNVGDMGIAIPSVVYPYYSFGIIYKSILTLVISAGIVSYLPSKKISKLKPTEAIKGKVS